MGNHEWFGGDSARFAEMTGQELNQDIVIKGFHFIGMTPLPGDVYASDTLTWLSDTIKAAAEEDPEKPIFTFRHHHLQDTVCVSHGVPSSRIFEDRALPSVEFIKPHPKSTIPHALAA